MPTPLRYPCAPIAPLFVRGFGYNFTNYDFRKTLDRLRIYLARGVKFNVVVEIQCLVLKS